MRRGSLVHGIWALAALSLPSSRGAEAATNCGSPGPDQAIVWQNDDFTGNCDVLAIGSYPYSAVNAMSVGNDNISAVSVGSNVKITLYEHDLPGTGPVGDWLPVIATRSVASDFNDLTSSIRVESRTGCPNLPTANQCVVLADINWSGNCDVIDLGYPVSYPKLVGLSVGNDAISSLYCGANSAVLMWEHEKNGGSSFFSGQGIYLPFVGWIFNDKASSLVVQAAPVACTVHDQTCADNAFCKRPSNGCTATAGVCTPKTTTCSPVINPSCGCDGNSYANDCEREAAGVNKWADGVCSSPTCPSTAPSPGASCSTAGDQCMYVVPATGCIQPFTCTSGHWSAPAPICDF